MFSGDGIRVSFDFGLYSDPLTLPEQATQVKEFSKAVGGHLAHHVSYSRGSINAVGIHFPKVSSTSIGPLKLTVLAQSRDMTKLRAVDEAFATIKFK
jgi:hypothetical protein